MNKAPMYIKGMAGSWMRVDPLDLIETYGERAGIAEYECGFSRAEAEAYALRLVDQRYLVLKRADRVTGAQSQTFAKETANE